MTNLFFWSDKYGGLEFPLSTQSPELIRDDYGDTPIISSMRMNDSIVIKTNITTNIKFVNNRKYVDAFLDTLVSEQVKALTLMDNKFKVFIDFVIYDEKKTIIEEGVKIHPLDDVRDSVRIFDINDDDCANYIKEKLFKSNVCLYGPAITTCSAKNRGTLLTRKTPRFMRIRRIQIGAQIENESSRSGVAKLNRTIIDKTIHHVSPTTDDCANEFYMIYDSADDGASFSIIDFGLAPKIINLEMNISLGGFFSVCCATLQKIEDILYENSHKDDPSDNDPNIPDIPDVPETPSEYFSQFERCREDNPKASIVISDIDYEEGNYTGRCYPYSKVVEDIPDIEIGEFVEFVESLSILSL